MKHLFRAARLFLGRYKWLMIGGFISLLFADAASLVQPQFTRMIVDRGIRLGNLAIVIWMAVAMVGLAILRSVFSFLRGMLMVRTAQGIAYERGIGLFKANMLMAQIVEAVRQNKLYEGVMKERRREGRGQRWRRRIGRVMLVVALAAVIEVLLIRILG